MRGLHEVGGEGSCFRVKGSTAIKTETQLFSGTNSFFPLFFWGGGCPTKHDLPQKGFPFLEGH